MFPQSEMISIDPLSKQLGPFIGMFCLSRNAANARSMKIIFDSPLSTTILDVLKSGPVAKVDGGRLSHCLSATAFLDEKFRMVGSATGPQHKLELLQRAFDPDADAPSFAKPFQVVATDFSPLPVS
jgi:hypothetical protein